MKLETKYKVHLTQKLTGLKFKRSIMTLLLITNEIRKILFLLFLAQEPYSSAC